MRSTTSHIVYPVGDLLMYDLLSNNCVEVRLVVESTRGDGSEDETHTGLRASLLKAMRLRAHSGMGARTRGARTTVG